MATYIKGLMDSPLAVTPFTPDYSFLQTVMKTKDAEYEQGFAKVKGLYNSLLNSKVSNAEDQEVQKAYIADAERKLQNLASVDLSVPQNVGIANSVFKTFLNDDELMYDINLTKLSDQQLALGQSFLSSDDEKQRAKHSSISDEYVKIPTDELKRAKRGDGSILQVRPRYYVPSVNLYEKFKGFLDASKYKAVQESPNGQGYIFTTVDGKKVEMGVYNLMNGLLTGDERKYFDAWGEVVFNREVNNNFQQGMSDKDARMAVATKLYTENLDALNKSKNATIADKALVDAKITSLQQLNRPLTPYEQELSASLTISALDYKKAIDYYESTINKEISQKDNTIRKNFEGKSKVFSDMILERDLRSIAKGVGTLAQSSEVKSDDAYWKKLEHLRGMEQLEINRMKAIAGMSDGDSGGGSGGGTGGGGRKLTEAEKLLAKTNTPTYEGLQAVPKDEGKPLPRFYNNLNMIYDAMMDAGIKGIGEMLGEEFSKGGPAAISVLTNFLVKKKQEGKFFDEAIEINKGTGPEAEAMRQFIKVYKEDITPYLSKAGKFGPNDPISYGDVYDFLLNRSYIQYDSQKEVFGDAKKIELLRNSFGQIEQLKQLADIYENDKQTLEDKVYSQADIILGPDKYDVSLLFKTDANGYKRLITKNELNDIYAAKRLEMQKELGAKGFYNRDDVARSTRMANVVNDYDKIEETLNKYVGEGLTANKFTLSKEALSQFGTYYLPFRSDVPGEVAENSIAMLLSDANLSVGKDNTKNAIDLVPLLGTDDLSQGDVDAARKVLAQLASDLKNPDSGYSGTVQFKQFTGDRADNRKEYVIRIDSKKLQDQADFYEKKDNRTNEDLVIGSIYRRIIKEGGVSVRTNDPIPGGTGEYNVLERYYQSRNKYTSPEMAKDLYQFTILKKVGDQGYELSPDSYYMVKNPTTGAPEKINLTGIDFPPQSSFLGLAAETTNYIIARIEAYTKKLQQQQANPGNTKVYMQDILNQYNYKPGQ